MEIETILTAMIWMQRVNMQCGCFLVFHFYIFLYKDWCSDGISKISHLAKLVDQNMLI